MPSQQRDRGVPDRGTIIFPIAMAFTPSVVCASCKSHVAHLHHLACVQDDFGCHLVCALDRLSDDVVQQRPHPEEAKHPFKRGKLKCSCDGNIGNIQNNVKASLPAAGLIGHGDYAVLKFVDLSFAAAPHSDLIPRLTGALLGKEVGFILPGKGGRGGGRVGGGGRGRGGDSSSASGITPEHVLRAAGRSDDLRRLLQAEERRDVEAMEIAAVETADAKAVADAAAAAAQAATLAAAAAAKRAAAEQAKERRREALAQVGSVEPVTRALAAKAPTSGANPGQHRIIRSNSATEHAGGSGERTSLNQPVDADAVVVALRGFILANGGEISSTSGVADFYNQAGEHKETYKEMLRSLGPKGKVDAFARVGLVLEKRAAGSDVIRLADGTRPDADMVAAAAALLNSGPMALTTFVSALYKAHPAAREAIKAAGNAKKWLSAHADFETYQPQPIDEPLIWNVRWLFARAPPPTRLVSAGEDAGSSSSAKERRREALAQVGSVEPVTRAPAAKAPADTVHSDAAGSSAMHASSSGPGTSSTSPPRASEKQPSPAKSKPLPQPPPPPPPPSTALVKFVGTDKNGRRFGKATLDTNTGDRAEKKDELFFIHGTPPKGGFKMADGVVRTAGLPLEASDRLDSLRLITSSQGDTQIAGACLSQLSASNVSQRLQQYLAGLVESLANNCSDALNGLCQGDACAIVWASVAKAAASNAHVAALAITAFIDLTLAADNAKGSARPLGRSALENVFASGIDLEVLVTASAVRAGHEDLISRFSSAMGAAWALVPSARSSIFAFFRALTRSKPVIAASVLGPEMLLKLVGAMMPSHDVLSRYEWDELPLRLVADEIEGGANAQSAAVLHAVLRDGGSYTNFDSCKQAVSLAPPVGI